MSSIEPVLVQTQQPQHRPHSHHAPHSTRTYPSSSHHHYPPPPQRTSPRSSRRPHPSSTPPTHRHSSHTVRHYTPSPPPPSHSRYTRPPSPKSQARTAHRGSRMISSLRVSFSPSLKYMEPEDQDWGTRAHTPTLRRSGSRHFKPRGILKARR